MEPMETAAQRYPFAEIIPPLSDEHGLEAWRSQHHADFHSGFAPSDLSA